MFSFGLFQITPRVLSNKDGLLQNKAGLSRNNPALLTSRCLSALAIHKDVETIIYNYLNNQGIYLIISFEMYIQIILATITLNNAAV